MKETERSRVHFQARVNFNKIIVKTFEYFEKSFLVKYEIIAGVISKCLDNYNF